jgi:hypothetical protein
VRLALILIALSLAAAEAPKANETPDPYKFVALAAAEAPKPVASTYAFARPETHMDTIRFSEPEAKPKPPVPFTKTEQLAASVLSDMSQRLQQAIEEVTVEICKRAKIERAKCEIDWQNGMVAEKAPETKPAGK